MKRDTRRSLSRTPDPDTNSEPGRSGKIKPPPNYSSRMVQFKLMALVASLLLVFLLMMKAGDPETWAFMGFDQQSDTPQGEDETPIDTRLIPGQPIPSGSSTKDANSGKPDSTNQAISEGDQESLGDDDRLQDQSEKEETQTPSNVDPRLASSETDIDLFAKTMHDLWRQTLNALDSDQRDLLVSVLYHGRMGLPLEGDQFDAWRQLNDWLSEKREAYHAEILQAVSELPLQASALKRKQWTDVLGAMQSDWAEVKPALDGIPEGTTIEQVGILSRLQSQVDDVMLEWVKDDVVGSRFVEKQIWFRLFERVRSNGISVRLQIDEQEQNLSEQDKPLDVSFLQLFKQPNAYRGKTVRMRGKLYRTEYRKADENPYGVEGYHVLWFRSEGKSAAPVVVYSLNLPNDFPKYDENQRVEFAKFQAADITVEGVFYKRWAYNAQDGLRVAPMILSKEFDWQPFEAASSREAYKPTPLAMVGIVAVIALVAAILAILANRLVKQKTMTRRFVSQPAVQQSAVELMKNDRGPGLHFEDLANEGSDDQEN